MFAENLNLAIASLPRHPSIARAPARHASVFRHPLSLFLILFLVLFLGNACWIAEASAAGKIAAAKSAATREPATSLSRAQTAEATQAYAEAVRAFNLGQWDEALAGFQLSYKISGDPALLFNVAQTHRQAGRPKEAITAYRSYLRERPDAPNRELVESKIRELEALTSAKPAPLPATAVMPAPADVKPVERERLAPAAPPVVARSGAGQIDLTATSNASSDTGTATTSGHRWWLWTGIGVAVVAGVATTLLLTTRGPSRDDTCPSGLSGCIQVGR